MCFLYIETRMNEKDIDQLLCLLQNYSCKWRKIGLALGFVIPELNTISNKPMLLMDAPQSFLLELLTQWVQWPTKSHPPKPTLEALCKALKSSLVGLGSLADTVCLKMRQNTGKDAVETQYKALS